MIHEYAIVYIDLQTSITFTQMQTAHIVVLILLINWNNITSTGGTDTSTLINIFQSYFIIHDEVGRKINSTEHRSHASVSITVWGVTTLGEQCSRVVSYVCSTSFLVSTHRHGGTCKHTPAHRHRHSCMATQQGQDCLQQPVGLIVTFAYHCLGNMLGGLNELHPFPPPLPTQ